MKNLSVIFTSIALLAGLTGPVIAEAKRPPTAKDCDPSSWVIDPDVDYRLCEPGFNPNA